MAVSELEALVEQKRSGAAPRSADEQLVQRAFDVVRDEVAVASESEVGDATPTAGPHARAVTRDRRIPETLRVRHDSRRDTWAGVVPVAGDQDRRTVRLRIRRRCEHRRAHKY